jgi:elongation factor P
MAAVPSTNLRKGMAIRVNGDLGLILDLQHRTPGNLSGFVQCIMRSFGSGKSKDMRFSASERVEVVETDRQSLEFSYHDNTGYNFMHPETYETLSLPEELLGDGKDWLVENMAVDVLFIEGKPVTVELPATVDVEVTSAPPTTRPNPLRSPPARRSKCRSLSKLARSSASIPAPASTSAESSSRTTAQKCRFGLRPGSEHHLSAKAENAGVAMAHDKLRPSRSRSQARLNKPQSFQDGRDSAEGVSFQAIIDEKEGLFLGPTF